MYRHIASGEARPMLLGETHNLTNVIFHNRAVLMRLVSRAVGGGATLVGDWHSAPGGDLPEGCVCGW